ncbi:CDGSH iron-sulfur domain-containing protein [Pengzhenrongella sicca]|uniref:CDGSH iron-sulfur domain-containing protein n=1 Tax=Pengzhenrongella sicca TaxID=2819238 RepID=A0A8A4ZGL9_9MICO|nr:CDGSH iron-sulfur domain-containing protein [Pengzhenrongella sicca]QTE30139.1 CDGSH iron-sulfur domain-containing protein [Pengzhenrongella sicca]
MSGVTGRPVTIVACPDGPLLVRGDALLVDAAGVPIPRRRATVALCRCGASAIAPFCDGSHKFTGFTTGASAGASATGAPAAREAAAPSC